MTPSDTQVEGNEKISMRELGHQNTYVSVINNINIHLITIIGSWNDCLWFKKQLRV